MNNFMCFTLGFITGAGLGCVVALTVKRHEQLKFEAELDKEVQSVKDAYHKAFSITSEKELEPIIGKDKMEALREANKRIEYNKYAKLTREVEGPVVNGSEYEPVPLEGPSEDELQEEEDHPPEGGPEPPFVITPEEFAGEPEYAKEDLYYYIVSDALVDNHDVEVDDIDRTIGIDNLRHMGEIEPGCLWIRNPNTMVDYQIVGIHGAWNG